MNNTLYILVDDFSSNKKEGFFEKELSYLCATFEKVYVVSLYPNDNKVLNYSSPKLEVLQFNYFAPCNRIKVFFNNFFPIVKLFSVELASTHNKWFYIKNLGNLLNQLIITFSAASNMEKFIEKDINANTLFYAFWFKQWVAALSIIKLRNPNLKFVSRVHGGDYDEDQVKTTLPFRYFQLKMIDKILPVSDFGKNYLIRKFKVNPFKIITSRLAININPLLGPINEKELIIVSCSSVIELKRVHLIVEILKNINLPCKWIHFGDGPLLNNLKERAAELNHQLEFKGHVPNLEFINYLGNNPVSIFINVSESEGIPVSMMEAISHGIPLIGTAVCGIPEIANEETGFLIPLDFNPEVLASKIEQMHLEKKIYTIDFRKHILNYYKKNFFGNENYNRLSELLVHI